MAEPFEPAYQQFLDRNLQYVIDESEASPLIELNFVDWVVRVYRPENSPRVHSAAVAAKEKGDLRFVKGGLFADSVRADRWNREVKGEHAKALTDEDLEFVRNLGQQVSGNRVRFAADSATSMGDKIAEVVEFFNVGWLVAAASDWQDYSTEVLTAEAGWRRSLLALTRVACADENALIVSPVEGREVARNKTIRSWLSVVDCTAEPMFYWNLNRESTHVQVSH